MKINHKQEYIHQVIVLCKICELRCILYLSAEVIELKIEFGTDSCKIPMSFDGYLWAGTCNTWYYGITATGVYIYMKIRVFTENQILLILVTSMRQWQLFLLSSEAFVGLFVILKVISSINSRTTQSNSRVLQKQVEFPLCFSFKHDVTFGSRCVCLSQVMFSTLMSGLL